MTTALERGERSASRPVRSLPPGKKRYPLYRRLGGHQGRSGQVRKISPPPGFDPRTVHSVTSSYTNYVTRPTTWYIVGSIWRTFWGRQLPGGLRSCRDWNRVSNLKQTVQELWCDVDNRRENLRFHIRKYLEDVNTAWDVDSIYPPKRQ
jgi:hypothetical protein